MVFLCVWEIEEFTQDGGGEIKNDFGLFGLCADTKNIKKGKNGAKKEKLRIKTFKSTTIFK